MPPKDQYIRHLEIQNQNLMNENERLKSELYKLQLKSSGGFAGVDAIIEKADQERQKYEYQIAQQNQIIQASLDALHEQSSMGIVFPRQTPENAEQLEAGKVKIVSNEITFARTLESSLIVEAIVTARFGLGPEDVWIYRTRIASYSGTKEQLQSELDLRLRPLISGSPMFEDMPATRIPGLSDKDLVMALNTLSPSYTGSDLEDEYQKIMDAVFRSHILPKLDRKADPTEARKLFREIIRSAYDRMYSMNRGTKHKPTVKPGRIKREAE